MLCSVSELKYAREGVHDDVRMDGRSRSELRPMLVECDLFPQPNGSARVTVPPSGTDVVAAVKADIVEVDPSAPNRGSVEVSVSLGAGAASAASQKQADADASAMTAALQECLCAPGAMDLDGLCVAKGRYAWRLFVDVTVLQQRGSPDAAVALAAYAALQRARLPRLKVSSVSAADGFDDASGGWGAAAASGAAGAAPTEDTAEGAVVDVEIEVVDDVDASVTLSELCKAEGAPVTVCFAVLDGILAADPLPEEEAGAECTLRVAVNRSGEVLAVRTGSAGAAAGSGAGGAVGAGTRPLAAGVLESAAAMARAHAASLFAAVDAGMAASTRRAEAMEEADRAAVRELAERYGELPKAAADVVDAVMAEEES